MNDWIERIEDFVKMTGNDILKNAGTISHQQAIEKANNEYLKYKELNKNEISEAEKHFINHIEKTAKHIKPKK